jgi:antitoxin component YwqK of YwqJK toxin-antitoxin module
MEEPGGNAGLFFCYNAVMPRAKPFVKHHRDGSLWAKGQTLDGVLTGYWEWFRKTGTRMRSGYFKNGEQTGQWTTYDAKGRVYKVTQIKPKA